MKKHRDQVPAKTPSTKLEQITTHPDTEVVGYSHINSKFPLEIYSHVLDHVDDRLTLLSMLVLCMAIHGQAERVLYRSVWLVSSKAHRLFLKTILDIKRPHLARLVCQYTLSDAPYRDDEFNTLLTRALVTLVNLKYLSFRGASSSQPLAQLLPMETPCPFQLHAFSWNGIGAHLEPFLTTQHSLEILCLDRALDLPQIPTNSLQNLRSLSGAMDVVTRVLPGSKKVTHLECFEPWQPLTPPIDVGLVRLFSHIRILSLGIRGVQPSLGAIVALLGHIEILDLGKLKENDMTNLYKLTSLHTLVVYYYGWARLPVNPREILNEMTSLERIYLRYGWQTYQRWVRGAQESVEVHASEAVWWRGFF